MGKGEDERAVEEVGGGGWLGIGFLFFLPCFTQWMEQMVFSLRKLGGKKENYKQPGREWLSP